MRWDHLRVESPGGADALALFEDVGVVERTFDTPDFRGMTFYEIRARSVINRVPAASRMPFTWTINPYRGCSHACVYCFARNTHTYLDLDAGLDFNSRVVVKVNTPEQVRRELARPSWRGEPIAMGTNVDCYQRAEGRYRLMPGVIEALRDHANPFSILTKGSLILRDLPLLRQAAEVTDVSTSVSVGFVDRDLWRAVEPGTPNPGKRLQVCRELNEAGIGCGVLMAPILPFLTDSPEQLELTIRAIAQAGAVAVSPIVLHLRPGAREWYFGWLRQARPDLVDDYRKLYRGGAYADRDYQHSVSAQVRELAHRYGIGRTTPGAHRDHGESAQQQSRRPPPRTPAGRRSDGQPSPRPGHAPEQLSLL